MAEHDPDSPLVIIVDDDREFAQSLEYLLATHAVRARWFDSGEAFLAAIDTMPHPAIVFLDVHMSGKTGLDVLEALPTRASLVVVMMTGNGDIPLAIRAIQKGAVEFIEKPFSEERLLRAFDVASSEIETRLARENERRTRAQKLEQLSARERDVFQHLVKGLTSRSIAERLGLSVRTVEMHRANLVRRLGARSTAEAIALGLTSSIGKS